jgi:hypothetical protein
LDLLDGKALFLQVEVPGQEGAGAEFLQVRADGVPVWHQVKRQQDSGPWTIRTLVSQNVVGTWWPKISNGGRVVFVSSTSCRELAELVERASAAESWEVFDGHFLNTLNRDRFDRLRRAWGNPASAEVYAALRRIEVRQIGEPDLMDLLAARLGALVNGQPSTALAVLEQFIDDSTHRRLTARDAWGRLAEHGLQPMAQAGTGAPGGARGRHARGSISATQEAEGRGNATITQVAGNYINIQAQDRARPPRKRNNWRRHTRLLTGAAIAVLIAAAAAVAAIAGSPGSSRLPVQPLTGRTGAQLQAVPVPVISPSSQLAKMLSRIGTGGAGSVTGYEFSNSLNKSSPVCLGARYTGKKAEENDPVQALSCNSLALNEIWIPVQWEENHEKLTWLVNAEYQSMCLNVDTNRGQGTYAQLYNCYYNPNEPDDLALNEAWDFGDWYDNIKSGINPYPVFLGSGDFCLNADSQNTGPGKNNQLPDGSEVILRNYYHVTPGQYWF